MMMTMEETHPEQETQSSSPCIFEIPGEPAIVIDGVPDMSPIDNVLVPMDTASESEPNYSPGLGEWFLGREVRKMFGAQYYSGKVVKFDRAMNWYRVEYEDGDSEDLAWHELQEVLLPLDIAISLKALTLKILKCEKSVYMSKENTVRLSKSGTDNVTIKRKMGEEHHRILVTKSKGSGNIQENLDYGRTSQEKINTTIQENVDYGRTTQEKINTPIHENLDYGRTSQEKINIPIQENVDYGRTTQEKINTPMSIRKTINAEKQKRKTRNAVESKVTEGKT